MFTESCLKVYSDMATMTNSLNFDIYKHEREV